VGAFVLDVCRPVHVHSADMEGISLLKEMNFLKENKFKIKTDLMHVYSFNIQLTL
jgi:hypothetical protein